MPGAVREGANREIPTVVLGAVLLLGGIAWLLDATDIADVSWLVVLPGLLIVIGIGLVVGAVTGAGHAGLLPAGIVLTVFLTALWVLPGDLGGTLSGGGGERTEAPQTVSNRRAGYRLGVGKLVVDLRGLELEQGTTRIRAQVGTGELVVRLPDGLAVRAHGRSGLGNVEILDCEASGVGADRECETDDYSSAVQRLALELEMGIGQIEVTQ